MHWSEEIAQRIIERKPDKEEYVCAAGISPSGSIHIGNFRDVATSYFVVKALRKMGKKAKLLFSWDEFDRLRKVPVNVQAVAPEMEKCIGMPYVDVKNPFPDSPCKTYAEYFEQEFERIPSAEELAERLDIPADQVADTMKVSGRHISVDAPFADGDENSLLDVLINDDTPTPDRVLNQESLSKEVDRALQQLDERERNIVKMFFGIGGQEMTLEEIGAKYDLTRERVRQIKEKAIRRLKSQKSRLLKSYLGE